MTKIIVSNTQLTENSNLDVDGSLLNNIPSNQETTQTTTDQSSENTESQSNSTSSDASPTKVYYIASQDGSIASYNPTYILRKTGGSEFRIMLPGKAGTLALVEDIPTGLDGFVSKEELLNAVNTVEEENPLNVDDWTVEDAVNSYRSLLRQLKRISGWVEPTEPEQTEETD